MLMVNVTLERHRLYIVHGEDNADSETHKGGYLEHVGVIAS